MHTWSDEAFSISFHERLELIQYNAALGIANTITGSSKEKLYQEMGL